MAKDAEKEPEWIETLINGGGVPRMDPESQGPPGYQQVNQPYEPESLPNARSSYGSSRFESQYDPANVSGQVFGSNFSQPATSLPKAVVTTEMGHQNSLQQPYAAPTVSAEADKSLKYQSTLEFAANLLQQIQQRQQQQQQQQSGPGSRNQ